MLKRYYLNKKLFNYLNKLMFSKYSKTFLQFIFAAILRKLKVVQFASQQNKQLFGNLILIYPYGQKLPAKCQQKLNVEMLFTFFT